MKLSLLTGGRGDSLTHPFSVISANIAINRIDPKPRFYRMIWNVFRDLEPFRRWSRVWCTTQTDGRTDRTAFSNSAIKRRALKSKKCKSVTELLWGVKQKDRWWWWWWCTVIAWMWTDRTEIEKDGRVLVRCLSDSFNEFLSRNFERWTCAVRRPESTAYT